MKSYTVRARRRDGGWDLDVKGVGLTRVDRLTSADRAVRAHLDMLGIGDARTADLVLEFGAELEREVKAVREGRASADAASRIAAERSRALASRLVSEGFSGAEVALVLQVSPQRVSQLVARPRTAEERGTARKAAGAERVRKDKEAKEAAEDAGRAKAGKSGKAKAKGGKGKKPKPVRPA